MLVAAGSSDGALGIYTVDSTAAPGTLPSPIIEYDGTKTWLPVLSTDRRSMIYSVLRSGTKSDFTLWTATSDGTSRRRLFEARTPDQCIDHQGRPALIPNTDEIVLMCTNDQNVSRIVRTDINGQHPVTLIDISRSRLTAVNDPTVSPDGHTLVFWGSYEENEPRGGDGDLFWLDLDNPSDSYHELLEGTAGTSQFSDPVFSPIGDKLAWRGTDVDGNWEVYVADFTDRRLVNPSVVSDEGDGKDQDPMFSPDGDQVVYGHVPPVDMPSSAFDDTKSQSLWITSVDEPHNPHVLSASLDCCIFQATPAWTDR
jgi:Tol biopolymer transport system component